jgi:acyl-CoA carboxylase epsilon subunit
VSSDEENRPALRVVRGDASQEEIAVLLAVIAGGSGGVDDRASASDPGSAWTDRAALVRAPARPGPGAWRASAWRR